ncbi:MAG: YigZ family protein [Alkalispirochaeta sp.]
MRIPADVGYYEFTVKRSRFVGHAQRVDSREAAEQTVAGLRERHPDARHVVYAFAIGDEKNELLGMSDDGEPHGTAGRPLMEVLKGSGVRNCLIAVVRYFGGTKLGTGGLVHAYGDAAKGCIAELSLEEHRDLVPAVIECGYELYDAVRIVLGEAQVEIVSEDFGTGVTIECAVERGSDLLLQERLHDVSRGTIELILS